MSDILVPFNRPSFAGSEIKYITDAIQSERISGDGKYTNLCQDFLEKTLGVRKALLTTSCTDALEMCSLLLDIQPGDEVILPSFTFVSTANAFALRGGIPIFADIKPDTLNIDETKLESLITEKTKAIVVVHYAGVACEMNRICQIAKKHRLAVIEDNAHGFLGTYENKPLGSFGDLATLSFHETKNFTCGEGGALLINNSDFIDRAEILWQKGTNRKQFFNGLVDKYTWVDLGSSFLPSDMLAAFLFAQFENHKTIQNRRKEIWNYYHTELRDWAENNKVQMPFIPENASQAYHMFYLVFEEQINRDTFIAHLKKNKISSVFHYLPLHDSTMGRKLSNKLSQCPVTNHISQGLVRLPFFNAMTSEQMKLVVNVIKSFTVLDNNKLKE